MGADVDAGAGVGVGVGAAIGVAGPPQSKTGFATRGTAGVAGPCGLGRGALLHAQASAQPSVRADVAAKSTMRMARILPRL